MRMLLKPKVYLKKCFFVFLLGFISIGTIIGCSNSEGGGQVTTGSSQALTENDFANDPSLSADPEKHLVVKFLEHPDSDTPENDTGETGNDTIRFRYTRTLEHTFCWEDDDGEAGHFMELDDSEGNEIFRLDVNRECKKVILEAGNYVMSIHHDARIETSHPIFIIPNPEDLEPARETDGLINSFKVLSTNILNEILKAIAGDAFAQTVKKNISTLLRTNSCVECDLSGADLQGADLQGADLQGADLTRADLTSADLSNADCTDASFSLANLNSAILTDTDLTNADLNSANLSEAVLQFASATTAIFINSILTDADLTNADLTNVNLRSAILTGAILSGANLTNANFKSAILRGADLSSEAVLMNADLTNADLTNANLFNANLTNAKFSNAILTDALLGSANLTGATLFLADLGGATMRDAILTDANFFMAYLMNADLTNADLTGARLLRADLTGAELSNTIWCDGCICAENSLTTCDGCPPVEEVCLGS